MTEHVKAAIIGYWRMGASKEEMAGLTGVPYFFVERIIIDQQSKDVTQQEGENRNWRRGLYQNKYSNK